MGTASPLFAHEFFRLWIHIRRTSRRYGLVKVIRMNAPMPMPASETTALPGNNTADMTLDLARPAPWSSGLHAAGGARPRKLPARAARAFRTRRWPYALAPCRPPVSNLRSLTLQSEIGLPHAVIGQQFIAVPDKGHPAFSST